MFAHVVGLGLGVWMYDQMTQKKTYLQAFQNVLTRNKFNHVKVVAKRYYKKRSHCFYEMNL